MLNSCSTHAAAVFSNIHMSHPTIWKIIDQFKNEEALTRLKKQQLDAGMQVTHQKQVYRKLDDRLKTVTLDYDNRERLDYLRGIAYNISYEV